MSRVAKVCFFCVCGRNANNLVQLNSRHVVCLSPTKRQAKYIRRAHIKRNHHPTPPPPGLRVCRGGFFIAVCTSRGAEHAENFFVYSALYCRRCSLWFCSLAPLLWFVLRTRHFLPPPRPQTPNPFAVRAPRFQRSCIINAHENTHTSCSPARLFKSKCSVFVLNLCRERAFESVVPRGLRAVRTVRSVSANLPVYTNADSALLYKRYVGTAGWCAIEERSAQSFALRSFVTSREVGGGGEVVW